MVMCCSLIVIKLRAPNIAAIIWPMDQEVIAPMKLHYRDDHLRTLADKDNIIALQTKMTVLDAIYNISWVWSSVNSVTLIQSCRKLLTYIDDGLQGFPNEKFS